MTGIRKIHSSCFVDSLAAGVWLMLLSAFSCAADQTWEIVSHEFIESAPAVAEVHSPNITEAADGALVAVWFGGTKEGNPDITIWGSRFENGKWREARKIAGGTGENGGDAPVWDPVIHKGRDGTLFLFFSVGFLAEKRWAEMMVSRDNGVSWAERRKLPNGMMGPVKTKPLETGDGKVLIPSGRATPEGTWEVWMETSDSGFKDWTADKVVDGENLRAFQPALLPLGNGRIFALCRTTTGKIARASSDDSGATWSPLESMGLPMIDSALDTIALREGGFLLAYNPGEAPEKPKDTDPREPRCPLEVRFSKDAGTWHTIATLENRPVRWGYAYPSLIEAGDGRVHVVYAWNRGRIRHAVLEKKIR